MNEQEYDRTRAKIVSTGQPCSGDNLYGMAWDFGLLAAQQELQQESFFAQRTDDAAALIQVRCAAAPDFSIDAATAAVVRTWLSRLRYDFCEAHLVTPAQDGARVDLVTQMEEGGLFVTAVVGVGAAATRGGPG